MSKFEIGKWYSWSQRGMQPQYGKVSELQEYTVHMSPWIINQDHYDESGAFDPRNSTDITEISVDVVRQFLPVGHPDLEVVRGSSSNSTSSNTLSELPEKWYIKTTEENYDDILKWRKNSYSPRAGGYIESINQWWSKTEPSDGVEISHIEFKKWVLKEKVDETPNPPPFIDGEVYWSNCPGCFNKGYIFKFQKMLSEGFLNAYSIISLDGNSFRKNSGMNDNHWKNLRLATPSERQWLDSCVKAGTFLPEKSEDTPSSQKSSIASFTPSTEQWTPKVGEWAVCKNNPGVAEEIVKVDQYLRLKGREQQCCHKENYRKALPHEIPGNTPSPTNKSLLEEAKRRYPVGTKVRLIRSNVGGDFGNEVRFTRHETYGSPCNQLFVDGNLLLYNDGEWAEIIEEPKAVGLGGSLDFSVGDWVTIDRWTQKPTVEQIVRIENGKAYIGRDRTVHLAFEKELRKATPEEIAKVTGNMVRDVSPLKIEEIPYKAWSMPITGTGMSSSYMCFLLDGLNPSRKKVSETLLKPQPSPKVLVNKEVNIKISKPKQIKLF